MFIQVLLSTEEVIECGRVNNSRKFWRMISKWCKRGGARVVKVVKRF